MNKMIIAAVGVSALAATSCAPQSQAKMKDEEAIVSGLAATAYPGGDAIAHLGAGRLLYTSGRAGPAVGTEGYPEPRPEEALTVTFQDGYRTVACGLDDLRGRGLSSAVGKLTCGVFTSDHEGEIKQFGTGFYTAPLDLLVTGQTTRVAALDDRGKLNVLATGEGNTTVWSLVESKHVIGSFLPSATSAMVLSREGADCRWYLHRLQADGRSEVVRTIPAEGAICQVSNLRVMRAPGDSTIYILAISGQETQLTTVMTDGTLAKRSLAHKPGRVTPAFTIVRDGKLYFEDGRAGDGRPVVSIVDIQSGAFRELVLPTSGSHPRLRGLIGDAGDDVWALLKGEDWVTVNLGDIERAAGN